MIEDQGSPRWLDDYNVVEIDLRSLEDFAQAIERAARANFADHASTITGEYAKGVQFGQENPGAEVRAARRKYRDCLDTMCKVIDSYVDATLAIANAARTIGRRYGNVDAMAAARLEEVRKAIQDAARMDVTRTEFWNDPVTDSMVRNSRRLL